VRVSRCATRKVTGISPLRAMNAPLTAARITRPGLELEKVSRPPWARYPERTRRRRPRADTPRRVPVRSCSCFHRGRGNTVPANVSSHGISGVDGSINNGAQPTQAPAPHAPGPGHDAPPPSRMSTSRRHLAAGAAAARCRTGRRNSRSSRSRPWPEKVSDSRMSAKEYDYRCEGTSQAQPG